MAEFRPIPRAELNRLRAIGYRVPLSKRPRATMPPTPKTEHESPRSNSAKTARSTPFCAFGSVYDPANRTPSALS